jgi:hypothetical protein
VRLALEVAAGLAQKSGVKVGSKLLIPDSVKALFPKAEP